MQEDHVDFTGLDMTVTRDGQTLTVDMEDVQTAVLSTYRDRHQTLQPDNTTVDEPGNGHLVLHLTYKPGQYPKWVNDES